MVPDSFLYRNSPVRTPSPLRRQNKSQELAFVQPSLQAQVQTHQTLAGLLGYIGRQTDTLEALRASPSAAVDSSRLGCTSSSPPPTHTSQKPLKFLSIMRLSKAPTRSHSKGKEKAPASIKLRHMCASLVEIRKPILSLRPF